MKIRITEKHPLPLRWNHWLNFPLWSVMTISGLAIYWANPVYILPDTWLERLGLGANLANGLAWHFAFGVLFTVNGLAYAYALIRTGHVRYLLPDRDSLRESGQVMLHDLGLRKELPPQRKYNAAQRVTYSLVFLLGVGATLTGFAIYKPLTLNFLLAALGGYRAARLEHFVCMLLFLAFFAVHVAQVVRAGWDNFRAMITGHSLEVTHESEPSAPPGN